MSFKDDLKAFLQSKRVLERYSDRKINHFGDIGELIAAQLYDIKLCEAKNEFAIDGLDKDDLGWQIKVTFTENRKSINFPQHPADGYLALKVHENGDIEEIYNGPYELVLATLNLNANDLPKFVSINTLKKIKVSEDLKLPRR